MGRQKFDGLALFAVFFAVFLFSNGFVDRFKITLPGRFLQAGRPLDSDQTRKPGGSGGFSILSDEGIASPDRGIFLSIDQVSIQMPYPEYSITQGLHGFEYGHLAIDITAGKGAEIHSPINGIVSACYTDPAGGTILLIENERWQVTLVHGVYSVSEGERVSLGQTVGREGNQGNTIDMEGRPCMGRDCGYHTHINIYDRQAGRNVNPFELFPGG